MPPQPRSSHPRYTHVCRQPQKKTTAIKLKFGYEGDVPRVSGYTANAPQKAVFRNQDINVDISAGLPTGITAEKTKKERKLPMFSLTEIIEPQNSMMHVWNLT